MATNRDTVITPSILTQLSKVTLADLVWELVGVTTSGSTADDEMSELFRAAGRVKAPHSDMRTLSRAKEGL